MYTGIEKRGIKKKTYKRFVPYHRLTLSLKENIQPATLLSEDFTYFYSDRLLACEQSVAQGEENVIKIPDHERPKEAVIVNWVTYYGKQDFLTEFPVNDLILECTDEDLRKNAVPFTFEEWSEIQEIEDAAERLKTLKEQLKNPNTIIHLKDKDMEKQNGYLLH